MNGKLDEQRKIKGSTKEQQIDIESEWTFRIYPNTQIYIYIFLYLGAVFVRILISHGFAVCQGCTKNTPCFVLLHIEHQRPTHYKLPL